MTGGIAGVERFDSPGKGRGLRVTRGFAVGELVLCSPAYSFVLSGEERGSRCEFCFTKKEKLARCGKCKKASYCNAKCQKGDWAMHKLECSAMMAFKENWCPSEISRLVARILAKKRTQKERCVSEKILLIDDIQSHVEDVDNEKRERNEAEVAGLHRFFSKHLEFPDHKDLLALISQVACNGFTIEDDELSHLGTALYPDVALINHSCLPSAIVTYDGTAAQVRAVRNMEPGDEVLISYIDLMYPTDDRNNRLRESYYFTCDCRDCKSKSGDKAKLRVRKRSDPVEPQAIGNMVRYARKTVREFRAVKHIKNILSRSNTAHLHFFKKLNSRRLAGRMSAHRAPLRRYFSAWRLWGALKALWRFSRTSACFETVLDSMAPPSELLEMCEQSLEEMGSVFEDANVYMVHVMYQAMGVCLYMEDPEGALRYGEKIIKHYSKFYPPFSLNVSSMYLKLGRLYMGLERRSAGVSAFKKAMAIMEVAHGKDHFYLTELRKEMAQQ